MQAFAVELVPAQKSSIRSPALASFRITFLIQENLFCSSLHTTRLQALEVGSFRYSTFFLGNRAEIVNLARPTRVPSRNIAASVVIHHHQHGVLPQTSPSIMNGQFRHRRVEQVSTAEIAIVHPGASPVNQAWSSTSHFCDGPSFALFRSVSTRSTTSFRARKLLLQ